MLCTHRHQVLVVDKPVDEVVTPLDGVGMKLLAGRFDINIHTRLLVERPLETVVCCQEGTLSCCARIDHLHDVELAAPRPGAIGGVRRQHPHG